MKTIMKSLKLIFSVMIIVYLGMLLSCGGGEPGQSAQDKTTNLLIAHAWKIKTVTINDTDQSSVFANLSITFTKTAYSSVNGKAEWPASGTWSFDGSSATDIVRNDGLTMTIESLSDTSLVISFLWDTTTFGGGRVQGVSGQTVFTFGN